MINESGSERVREWERMRECMYEYEREYVKEKESESGKWSRKFVRERDGYL